MRCVFATLSVSLALTLGTAASATAQDAATAAGYVSDRWTSDNGLPQNSIGELLQTRDGYLWIASHGGVARFDGVAFVTLSSGMRNGLHSDRVLSVAEDSAGHVWVGTESGLSRYNGTNFRTWSTAEGMPGEAISALARNPRGGLIFGTRNGAVGVIQDSTLRVIAKQGSILGQPISRIIVDRSNDVWIWSQTGIWLADLKTGSFRRMAGQRRGTETAPISVDEREGIWSATDSGVVHLTRNRSVDYPIRHLIGDPKKMCKRRPACGPWVDLVDFASIAPYGGPQVADRHTRRRSIHLSS